jgi:ribonucleoside-diphosphate reductase alpha chain
MPYVFYRDTVHKHNANKHAGNIYSTQLCTEICQNSSPSKFIEEVSDGENISLKYLAGDLVTCNLASINVAKVNKGEDIERVIPIAMRALDNVITLNLYPLKEAERTALRYRPVALGYLGFAEYLATN